MGAGGISQRFPADRYDAHPDRRIRFRLPRSAPERTAGGARRSFQAYRSGSQLHCDPAVLHQGKRYPVAAGHRVYLAAVLPDGLCRASAMEADSEAPHEEYFQTAPARSGQGERGTGAGEAEEAHA